MLCVDVPSFPTPTPARAPLQMSSAAKSQRTFTLLIFHGIVMFWKPHKKLSAALEGNKTARTNGRPFCLAPRSGACIRGCLSVWLGASQTWSSVYVTLANGPPVTLWEKALKDKSNSERTRDSQPSWAQTPLGSLAQCMF